MERCDCTSKYNWLMTRGFQGIITGLGGISGAMSAAGGAYGLFAGENENLQKIMTKVQSLMAITIGLQQISQTLNKDSAFMLVTVNGLKKWWNAITAKSIVLQNTETVAVKGTTVATKGLATGFKSVGRAIMSIPAIGWVLAAVTAIVGAFALLKKKQKESREEQEKNK